MQIEPQYTIPLIYQIVDPSDSTVYYVRAIVYDSLTRTVLATKNLVSQGNGLWSSTVTAPVDSTGLGRHIHVIIKVYTDSGYTTLSTDYNQQIDKYLVKTQRVFGGTGSSGDVDYDKIKNIIKELLKPIIEDDTTENKKEMALLNKINKDVAEMCTKMDLMDSKDAQDTTENEPPEPVDFSPIINEIRGIGNTLGQKMNKITIPKPYDYSSSFKELGHKMDSSIQKLGLLESTMTSALDVFKSAEKSFKNMFTSMIKSIEDKNNSFKKILTSKNIEDKNSTFKKVVESIIDYNGLNTQQISQDSQKEATLSKLFPKNEVLLSKFFPKQWKDIYFYY